MNVVAVVCVAAGSRGQAVGEKGAEQMGTEQKDATPAKSKAKTSTKTAAKSNSKAPGSKGRGKGKGRNAASRGKQPAKTDEDNDVDNDGAGETVKAEGRNSGAVCAEGGNEAAGKSRVAHCHCQGAATDANCATRAKLCGSRRLQGRESGVSDDSRAEDR